MNKILILLAAGSGSRMNTNVNKIFLDVAGKSVLSRSLLAFSSFVDKIVVVYRPEDLKQITEEINAMKLSLPVLLAEGGTTRQESVKKGYYSVHCAGDDLLLIHDCARCLVSQSLISRVIQTAVRYGAAVPAVPAVNTIKIGYNGLVKTTPDRSSLFEIQTPQCIKADLLKKGFEAADQDGFLGTDDASLLEHCGIPVALSEGDKKNIKITTKEDLEIANMYMNSSISYRIGHGYDVHQLAENRKLILCGLEIPYEKGLLGHSDADVAVHALMDAMLGAASMGDIGQLFPDTDPQYEGINSLYLLKNVCHLLNKNGYTLINADITIIAQKPKLSPYISEMKMTIASALVTDPGQINIKATTTEHLGFEGRMEGISSHAVCLLSKQEV
jgi:2-C-methyl-D-erythritol 4-phosphate cytidylyltransferase/2-C-methyl-D-erythritol 2,4-cyclodiphosphate synthase